MVNYMKAIKAHGFVSAFPGTGKSSIYGNAPKNGLYPLRKEGNAVFRMPMGKLIPVYDSDSSTFDKSEFPRNYIQHMKDIIHRHCDIGFVALVSSHKEVRLAMQAAGIPYTLVYPDRSLKDEYIARYKKRGSPDAFIELMENKWDDFIDSCESDGSIEKIILSEGQYLSDVL